MRREKRGNAGKQQKTSLNYKKKFEIDEPNDESRVKKFEIDETNARSVEKEVELAIPTG